MAPGPAARALPEVYRGALFIFAILLILYVILWYICRDVDCDHGL